VQGFDGVQVVGTERAKGEGGGGGVRGRRGRLGGGRARSGVNGCSGAAGVSERHEWLDCTAEKRL